MFVYGTKRINLIEFTSTSVTTKNGHLAIVQRHYPKYLQFSSNRLAISIARAKLTRIPNSFHLYLEALSSFIRMQAIISTIPRIISFINGFRDLYRDFSRSSRIGEFAQGITYLFAQDILLKPFVNDFNGFLEARGFPTTSRKKSPDFAIGDYHSTRISLLESKGSSPKTRFYKLKTRLKEALYQCDSGENHLHTYSIPYPVYRKYASAVWIPEQSDGWDATLYFADPEGQPTIESFDPILFAKYHYASWFMLIGYHRVAEELYKGLDITLERPNKEIQMDNQSFYILDKPTLEEGINFGGKTFGILKVVLESLVKNDITELQNLNVKSCIDLSREGIDIFADGTLVLDKI